MKFSRRIRGTRLSYICQKAQMDRNARPTRMVRLLFSFSSFMCASSLALFRPDGAAGYRGFRPMYIACSAKASSSGTSRYFLASSTHCAISSGLLDRMSR